MPPPIGRKMDRIRHNMENKYQPTINNPKGHNKYTKKKDMVKVDKVLSSLNVFKKLNKGEQYEIITKIGNELWREGKDYRNKKAKFTMMQKEFFGWDFK